MISDERLIWLKDDWIEDEILDDGSNLKEIQEIQSALQELLDARRKIDLLKEDAERLAACLISPEEIVAHSKKCKRYRENNPNAECTCGYQDDYDRHEQVMKEVE